MTTTDPQRLEPQDFDECFRGEPTAPDATADLARGRRRSRRSAVLVAGLVTAVAASAGLGLGLAGSPSQTAVPAAPPRTAPPVTVSSPFPSRTVSAGPGPSQAAPSAGPDTAPKLSYSSSKGYLDRRGRSHDLGEPPGAFSATTKHTYDLVRLSLDPGRDHLGAYERDAFTGGGQHDGIEIGQKLSWKVKGDPGEGMLLVAVTRAAPGRHVVTTGDDRDGLCAGTFGEASCKPTTVAGHQVFLDQQPGGGFVVDYVQPDGELASAWVDPLFGNNTETSLQRMDVSLADVMRLLTDPDLDVVG